MYRLQNSKFVYDVSHLIHYAPIIAPIIKAILADTPPKNKVSPKALARPYPTNFHLNNPSKTKAVITPEIDNKKA